MHVFSAITLAFAIGIAAVPGTVQAAPKAAATQAPDALTAMFVWWNAAYKDKVNGFTKASFEKHWTPDAVMKINGRVSASGSQDLADHFRKIQQRTEIVAIELPFLETFQSADGKRIFTYHVVTSRADGKDERDLVMGYANVRDGRISLIDFVSAPPAPPKPGK